MFNSEKVSHIPLRHPQALRALTHLLGSPDVVSVLVSTYHTWDQLVGLSDAEKLSALGAPLAHTQFPPAPPVLAQLPDGVNVLSRFEPAYPQTLKVSVSPPQILFYQGEIFANENLVSVIGASHPSGAGVEVAKAVGVCSTVAKSVLVAPLATGCGLLALWAAAKTRGKAVVVLPHGFGVTSTHQLLIDTVLAAGGGVVSAYEPGVQTTAAREKEAACLAVQMSASVVFAEVGLHESAGAKAARAAVAEAKHLVVPAASSLSDNGSFIPSTAFASLVFSSPREWSDQYFGTNHRIRGRCINGLSPADAVISTQKDLLETLKLLVNSNNPTN